VTPTGVIIKVGSNAVKSSSGYDLCKLFVGSEGTLGVITEATLRVAGIMEGCIAVITTFDSVKEATEAVTQIMQAGLSPAALELMDTEVVKALNIDRDLNLEEKTTLFMEFHGTSNNMLKDDLEFVRIICLDNNCSKFDSGIGREERNRMWEARHEARESIKHLNPGRLGITIDTAVPISKYSEMVMFAQKALEKRGLKGYIFGHAGSGNLHLDIWAESQDLKTWDAIHQLNDEVVEYAISQGGTATGEHGIGIGKRKFMRREHEASLEFMKRIKQLFDPNGIMNPGKIFE